jgi:hypothetical protein
MDAASNGFYTRRAVFYWSLLHITGVSLSSVGLYIWSNVTVSIRKGITRDFRYQTWISMLFSESQRHLVTEWNTWLKCNNRHCKIKQYYLPLATYGLFDPELLQYHCVPNIAVEWVTCCVLVTFSTQTQNRRLLSRPTFLANRIRFHLTRKIIDIIEKQ